MARSRISSCFCSCVRATTSSSAISWLSSSSSSSASLSPPWPEAAVPAFPPPTLDAWSVPSSFLPPLVFLPPRFFLPFAAAPTPLADALTALPLTCDKASTDGERVKRASGGNDVWRKGCTGTEDWESVEGLRRFRAGGLPLASKLEVRFLLGICAGDG